METAPQKRVAEPRDAARIEEMPWRASRQFLFPGGKNKIEILVDIVNREKLRQAQEFISEFKAKLNALHEREEGYRQKCYVIADKLWANAQRALTFPDIPERRELIQSMSNLAATIQANLVDSHRDEDRYLGWIIAEKDRRLKEIFPPLLCSTESIMCAAMLWILEVAEPRHEDEKLETLRWFAGQADPHMKHGKWRSWKEHTSRHVLSNNEEDSAELRQLGLLLLCLKSDPTDPNWRDSHDWRKHPECAFATLRKRLRSERRDNCRLETGFDARRHYFISESCVTEDPYTGAVVSEDGHVDEPEGALTKIGDTFYLHSKLPPSKRLSSKPGVTDPCIVVRSALSLEDIERAFLCANMPADAKEYVRSVVELQCIVEDRTGKLRGNSPGPAHVAEHMVWPIERALAARSAFDRRRDLLKSVLSNYKR